MTAAPLTRPLAATWRSFGPRHRLLTPRGTLGAWLVLWLWEVGRPGSGPSGCTAARPCTDTDSALLTAVALAVVIAAFTIPAVALAVVPFAATVSYDAVPVALVAVVVAWTYLTCLDELRRGARFRRWLPTVAGRATMPDEALRARRRRLWAAVAFASVLVAATAAATVWGVREADRQRRLERAAPVVDAEVAAAPDDAVLLRAGGREHEHVPYDLADFPAGSTVPVYDLGRELRPVAEPYDPAEATFPAMVLGAFAAVPVARAVRLALRSRRLRGEVPALEMSAADAEVGFDLGPVPSGRPLLYLHGATPPGDTVVVAGEIEPGGWVTVFHRDEPYAWGTAWSTGRMRDIARRTLQR